jgi:trehalose 6-phosphate phosphatase
MDQQEAVQRLSQDPSRTGIFSDFDGTLAEIVPRPEDARPVAGAAETLARLAERFAIGAVVSGRSLDDLRSRFEPTGVVLAGSYGRERSDRDTPRPVVSWGWDAVAEKATRATAGLDGVIVEEKDAGLALHYRGAPDRADEVRDVASAIAHEFGLQLRPGRLVYELVVPGPGKADAILDLVHEHGLACVLVAGDDAADLEAFDAVRSDDVEAVVVAIASDEEPAGLEARADLVVSGPKEFVAFLRRVADATVTA